MEIASVIFAAVAAGAAVVALYYAKATVVEAGRQQAEAEVAHQEEMNQRRRMLEEEFEASTVDYLRQIGFERLHQLDKAAEILLELATTVRAAPQAGSSGITTPPMRSVSLRLNVVVTNLANLGIGLKTTQSVVLSCLNNALSTEAILGTIDLALTEVQIEAQALQTVKEEGERVMKWREKAGAEGWIPPAEGASQGAAPVSAR